ncbi:LysR family transcriptional regulator [Gulosibacter sp. ACHW.36C]|uniref:LysR family transcriptional regulator n=1 Tax=Gulosibacter sediminis TaxID=1729695 RepID=A0ABY4MUR6_9MICO|nr:LysR family transcriptional regulator [Gulosibacter sediminis]UQN14165.1 LysR family transcriptional regulator [Gulosibacter sediminis]
MLDLRQLQALRAVHAAGSVTRAARELGWSQPTVDYHLHALEQLVGGLVLERTPRGSTPTEVGALLVERGDEILALSERAVADARELQRSGRTTLRFGTYPTAAALLPEIVARVRGAGRELEVVLKEVPQLLDDLHRGELDALLAYSVPTIALGVRPEFEVAEVYRDPLLVALPADHPLAAAEALDTAALRSLHELPWVLGSSERDPMDVLLMATFEEAGLSPEVSIRTDDMQVMLAMVTARLAVCLVPRLAAPAPPPGVALVPIADESFARTLLAVVPKDARRTGLSMRQLRTHLAAAIAGG